MLLLILLLVWVTLMVLLGVGSIWFQGYIYSEPESHLTWRGAAAGTLLAGLVAFWTYLHFRVDAQYDTLFRFSPREFKTFDKFRSVQNELDDKGTPYQLTKRFQGGRVVSEYHEVETPYRAWNRSPAIIVEEDGEEVRFTAERDENGNYRNDPGRPLKYVDPRGRVMDESSIGQLSTFRKGLFFGNILLNLFHLGLWFICFWLILRFQWSHALGLAIVFWTIMTILVVPMVLDASERLKPKVTSTQ